MHIVQKLAKKSQKKRFTVFSRLYPFPFLVFELYAQIAYQTDRGYRKQSVEVQVIKIGSAVLKI